VGGTLVTHALQQYCILCAAITFMHLAPPRLEQSAEYC